MTDDYLPPSDAIQRQPDAALAQPAFPDEFYVTLQPLTLDLLAHQLSRMDLEFDRRDGWLVARFADFVLQVGILNEHHLNIRATLTQRFPAASTTVLVGRCNWWNASQLFLKASTSAIVAAPPADGGSASAVARVQLDLDLPLPVGVAPVQVQSLIRGVLDNITSFTARSRLGDLTAFGWG